MQSTMKVCAAVLVVLILAVSLVGAKWSPEPATKWEYSMTSTAVSTKPTEKRFVADLNKVGSDGWEVVNVWINTHGITMVLMKRPL